MLVTLRGQRVRVIRISKVKICASTKFKSQNCGGESTTFLTDLVALVFVFPLCKFAVIFIRKQSILLTSCVSSAAELSY